MCSDTDGPLPLCLPLRPPSFPPTPPSLLQDGKIKVWRVRTGQCLRRFDSAHTQGVTSLAFSRDGSHVLSASYDGLARVHGIKSGKLLKELRGHTSYVNSAAYSADGAQVFTASSDATVRVWDAKTCDCQSVFRPPQAGAAGEAPVNSVLPNPQNSGQVVVCMRAPTLYVMNLQGQVGAAGGGGDGGLAWLRGWPGLPWAVCPGRTLFAACSASERRCPPPPPPPPPPLQVVKSFQSGKRSGGDFLAATLSPRGEWAYCLGEDGVLYCFSMDTGKLEHLMQVADKGPIGVTHHPLRNILASFSQDGVLKTWKAGGF